MAASYQHMAPFLGVDVADSMLRIAEAFGSFGTYADEATCQGLGEELPQRFDVGLNYSVAGMDGLGMRDDSDTAARKYPSGYWSPCCIRVCLRRGEFRFLPVCPGLGTPRGERSLSIPRVRRVPDSQSRHGITRPS